VESKKAQLVIIAHDVTPLEIVMWLPALCRKQGIPYCIVKGKAALGRFVGFKTCTCLCFDKVKSEDKVSFDKLKEAIDTSFNQKYDDVRKLWGGLLLGRRTRDRMKKKAGKGAK